jgi:hypothetical protein
MIINRACRSFQRSFTHFLLPRILCTIHTLGVDCSRTAAHMRTLRGAGFEKSDTKANETSLATEKMKTDSRTAVASGLHAMAQAQVVKAQS